ncbi:hypothetical protein GCM10009552_32140 [Rothia nasimurium]|uniref:CPBP family intramembrane metalloprotease n=1 Tax=Luteibacter anthropi TaxID=564369 RepID=A0A7X5UDD6_9GAMM|nr:type II CAAX endopeptidase family protein [Luteibacter anthropi]NII08192.1 CPBP family intramembrane metalloprotease [Luteibacter anthropi]
MAPFDWVVAHDPLGTFAWVVLAVMLAWIAFVEPWLGFVSHRRFLVALERQPDARRRFYLQWTIMLAVLGGVVLFAFAVVPGLNWSALGMRADISRIDPMMIVVLVGGGMAGVLIAAVLARRRSAPVPLVGNITALLPATVNERRYFILLSFAAGIFEEIVWRGMVVFAVYAVAPHAAIYWPLAISALTFGIVHVYQGARGVLATTYLGGVLCWLYLYSGSLWLPMVFHVLIDLRVAFVQPLRQQDPLAV